MYCSVSCHPQISFVGKQVVLQTYYPGLQLRGWWLVFALLSPRPAAAMQRFLVEPENVMVVPGRAAVLGCRVENRAGECRYPVKFLRQERFLKERVDLLDSLTLISDPCSFIR